MKTPPILTQPPGKPPVPEEIIVQSIVDIAEGMKRLNSTRLTGKAIIALIHDQSKLPKKTIEIVINNLADLEKDWLKPKPTT